MVTGHRHLFNKQEVSDGLHQLCSKIQPSLIISGGAAGADEIAVKVAQALDLPLRICYPSVYYPHLDQTDGAEIEYVTERTERPNKWDYIKDNFTRNSHMVGLADVCVVMSPMHPLDLVKEPKGGTVHAVKEWKKKTDFIFWVPGLEYEEVQLNEFTQLTLG